MKIFWVSCDMLRKCFFRLTNEAAQQECDFRMKEKDEPFDVLGLPNRISRYGNWFVEEEEIDDNKFGRCKNEDEPRLPGQRDCSVGSIRKLRNGVPEEQDDGQCGTCPYFEAVS